MFGRLQVTADADGISQVTNKRSDQAVVDFIADDVFASYGPREQTYKMLDKMMEHGNGEVFTCVVRFSGPPSSQSRGPEVPGISAIPSSDVPPAPSGMPPPPALSGMPPPPTPLEPPLLPPLEPPPPMPLEPPPPTSLESVPPLPPSPKQVTTESADRFSRALSIQIKSEISPGVEETGRQAEGSDCQVARPAGPETVRQAPAQDKDRQVAQRFGMDDPLPSRESLGDMAIVPASESRPQQSRRQKNKRSRNNNRGQPNNNNRHVYKPRPDPNTHILFQRMGPREPYDFQQRNEQCANIICGSCSARGHHLLDCVWPDARGDLVGCPFCNTKEHVMDLCPQNPSFDDWGWAYILIYRRANKPLLRTTRSWFHYAQIGHRFTSAHALDLKTAAEWTHVLSKGFPWTRAFGQNLVRPHNLSRGPWVRYDYRNDSASQNQLKRDPETMNSYVVFSNLDLMDERFNPR
ncbi:hypothetical protein CSIM01_10950 [Colletotrichum simmondsii]|uniref:Uncharacterized protein n=1 Tax=Colletotrichum simmondsii TaxID=703756 RepID=A0A135TY53_9PEZI|nr:hypothetical protein CSIM01_10950 [Colletotrichum simmondsii]